MCRQYATSCSASGVAHTHVQADRKQVRTSSFEQDLEQKLVEQDLKRQRQLADSNAPAAVAKANELNDPALIRRRGKLMLPAPQVSDIDLAALNRSGNNPALEEAQTGGGGMASKSLLGDYSQTPGQLQTPLRTARTPAQGDRIMQEA